MSIELLERKELLAGDISLLTDAEVQRIVFMREEEKLARDVYAELSEHFENPVFTNLVASESQHMAAVLSLIDGYGIDDPVQSDERGQFTNPLFTELYNDLTESGSQNQVAAMQAGVLIEETDIADLTDALNEVIRNDVRQVFENLKSGSETHLVSFMSILDNLGDVNKDASLDAADIDALYAAIRAEVVLPRFDLSGDDLVDSEDAVLLVEEIFGTSFGDANLDGAVSFDDFLTLSENFGNDESGWSEGDFNGDETVSFADFLILSANFGA